MSTATAARIVAGIELKLIMRSKAVLLSATAVPLIFAAFFVFQADETKAAGVGITAMLLVFFALFSVYITATTTFVTRRQDLFLKRLRSGEASDASIIAGVAIPPVLLFVAQIVVVLAAMYAVGVEFPAQWWWILVAIVGVVASSVSMAVATAALTPNASAAQISTMPYAIILLGTLIAGPIVGSRFFDLTPGGAVVTLVRLAHGMETDGSALSAVAGLALWVAIGWEIAKRRFRWEPRS